MASGKSLYLRNQLLDHVLGGGVYEKPEFVFLALYTKEPSAAGGGDEVTGRSYQRLAVPNGPYNFPKATDGVKKNGQRLSFPEAEETWGKVVAVGVHDAQVDGNLLYWGRLSEPQYVRVGTALDFPERSLEFIET